MFLDNVKAEAQRRETKKRAARQHRSPRYPAAFILRAMSHEPGTVARRPKAVGLLISEAVVQSRLHFAVQFQSFTYTSICYSRRPKDFNGAKWGIDCHFFETS